MNRILKSPTLFFSCLMALAALAAAFFNPAALFDSSSLVMMATAPALLPEVKELVDGLQRAFTEFKSTNDARLNAIEKARSDSDFQAKLAKIEADISAALAIKKDLEQIELRMNRSDLGHGERKSGESADHAAYRAKFVNDFARKGISDGLTALESKAWSVGTNADGGHALPKVIADEIEQLSRDLSPMRTLARVVQVGTSNYNRLVNKNGIASGWVGETAARTATNTSQFENVQPPMGEVYANPQITQQALDDLQFDVEGELMSQLAEELAIAEGAAFVSGDGTNKPKGFLAYTTAATADASRAFGTIEHIPTGVSADFAASNKADVLYDTVAKLKRAYRAGSVWTMGKSIMFEVMKFKDTTGQYLWQPALRDGMFMNLLGFPVVEMEDMPVKAANSLSIGFGNFRRGYIIVDRVGMRTLRDPFTNKPYVGFYTTKRVGGAILNSECIKVVKFSVS